MKYIGYEIFVESFYDADGDGIGDLRGISEKLGYLKELGVNLLWLTPFNMSPHYDNGYDVSDYYHVDTMYGSDEDLDDLLIKAHAMGFKVIMDLVLNHTSIEHEWFKKSTQGIEPYKDYYIWKDHPNNWLGFCGECWKYNEKRNQYYFHVFSYQQADLNYENPLVLEEMKKIMRFYLDKGIDGFRLDAISHLAKDFSFRNSRKSKDPVLDTRKFSNRKELLGYMRELKNVCKEYNAILIGEVGGEAKPSTLAKYTDKDNGIMDYAFNFNHCWMNDLYGCEDASEIGGKMFSAKRFMHEYMYIYKKIRKNSHLVNYWLNHDHPRLASQYGDECNRNSLSMLCGLQYLLPGMPFIYYGEEIGMENAVYTRRDEWHDEAAIKALMEDNSMRMFKHLCRKNRDAARSPMSFDRSMNGGFSTSKTTYRAISEGYEPCVSEEEHDPNSLLSFYKQIISFKKCHEDVYEGELEVMEVLKEQVIHYVVVGGTHRLEVYANISNKAVQISLPKEDPLITNMNAESACLKAYQLNVYYE